jgi:hypothetical protein
MTVELIKAKITTLANDCYEEGWNDCREYYAQVELLEKENVVQKRRLSLAVRLLRLAQASECGQLGQYDRFFQEGYEKGFEEKV